MGKAREMGIWRKQAQAEDGACEGAEEEVEYEGRRR